MFRYQIDSPTYLRETILELTDDPLLPWDVYPCLEWPRALFKDGYGMVYKKADTPSGKTQARAHRESWILKHGEIPPGVLICHHCDNPRCYRPSHLFAGDNSANMQDCSAKGRHVCVARIYPEKMKRGEGHGNAKLKDSQVLRIRELYAAGGVSQSAIAREIGVSQSLVGHIVNRKIWTHI